MPLFALAQRIGNFCNETGKPIGYPDKKIHKDCPHKGNTLTIKFN